MNEVLQAVVSANQTVARQARDLNVRAGEQVFTVLDRSGLQAFLNQQLAGARCVREIPDTLALRLPDLDSGMVGLVLEENPDAITVVEKEFPVSYRSGYAPTITVEGEDASVHYLWNRLPDEGVKLPGGRTVSVTVKFGYYDSYNEQDIPTLKKKVREYLNGKQWSSWSKPEIAVPDLSVEGAIVPEIVTAEYGRCIIDGTPLLAYGTVVVNGYRYYSSDPYFKAEWYRSSDEAEAQRQKVEGKIESIRAELREQQERTTAMELADEAKNRLLVLYGAQSMNLSPELRSRIYTRAYSYLPDNSAELKVWTTETKALIAEVEAAVVEAQRRKEAEEARRQAELERERQELAVIFTAVPELSLEQARMAKTFAETCYEQVGEEAVEILAAESEAPYGRTRRQKAVAEAIPDLVDTEAGERFLALSRAQDVDAMLAAAVAWLDHLFPPTQEEGDELASSLEDLAAQWGANIRRK